MLGIFDKLARKQEQQKTKTEADYGRIVDQLADGNEPDVDHVDATLRATGRTAADLQAEVTRRIERRTLAATAAQAKEVEGERERNNARIQQEQEKLEAAEQRFREATAPLYARNRVLADIEQQSLDARERLINTCPHQDVVRQRNETADAINGTRARLAKLTAVATTERANAERCLANLMHEGNDDVRAEKERVSKRMLADADRAAKDLPGLEKEVRRLEKEYARLTDLMAAP